MSRCQSTAYLRVAGVDVTTLRCDLDEHGPESAHRVALAWEDAADAASWPEAYDADEDFDVEVDALPHDEAVDAVIDSETVGDDLVVEHSHEAIDETVRERVDLWPAERAEPNRLDLQRRYGDGPRRLDACPCGRRDEHGPHE